jgi:hypothetical protein
MKYKEGHVKHVLFRPTPDLRQWLIAEAEKNYSTLNAEIVRNLLLRMKQQAGERREKAAV